MPSINDDLAVEMRRIVTKEVDRLLCPSPLLEQLKGAQPPVDCDCYACRPPLAFPGAPRTIQQAAAQEAAKPKEQRKPAKPKPRSIADEWLDRR